MKRTKPAIGIVGGVEITHAVWGIFEGQTFRIVLNNPLGVECVADLRLSHDGLFPESSKLGDYELDVIEELVLAAPRESAAPFSMPIDPAPVKLLDGSPSGAPHRIGLLVSVAAAEPEISRATDKVLMEIVNLGPQPQGEIAEERIHDLAKVATRLVFNAYLDGFIDNELVQGVIYNHAGRMCPNDNAKAMETDFDSVESIVEGFNRDRERYLDRLFSEASQRVQDYARSSAAERRAT